MFWGLIMEPNKRYTQVVVKPFHISQAAMDTSTGDDEPCQVMVVVDGKNFLVCTLQKDNTIQVPLDLYFKTGDDVSFLTNGKSNVHLTGYLDPEYEQDLSDEEDDEEEEEEETPAPVPIKNKRKLENSNDATTTKKAKQDKKEAKKLAKESSDSDDDDEEDEDEDEDQLQKLLEGEDVDTDENDESYKVNTSNETNDSDEEDSDEDDEDEEEVNEKKSSDEAETTLDTSKDDGKVDMSKLSKAQRRRLKKKLNQQAKAQQQVNGIDKPKDKQDGKQQKSEKKKDANKQTQDGEAVEKKGKKTLSGGVLIEDLKLGNGPIAKAGKTIMVYYEGRLKQNNKMFDNCVKGPGFKFRLGSKEVISGWDIGIVGMKVGGKRKIVCPPAMAYGAKGSPPVIPPNSTLVFEVELKNVK